MLINAVCFGQKPLEMALNSGWLFHKSGDAEWMKATVPGTVHTDLLDNKKIPDPYYRNNEKQVQWIDKANWVYQKSFDVPAELMGMEHLELDFKGLDTYADVYLNEQLLFKADNFFVSWTAEVKKVLKAKGNVLRLLFHSPTAMGLEGLKKLGYALPSPNDQSKTGGMGKDQVGIFLRKPGYHFGWDWGPRLVTSGIWLPVGLKGWNTVRLSDVFYEQQKVSKDNATLLGHVTLQATKATEVELSVTSDGKLMATLKATVKAGTTTLDLPFEMLKPRLWWPHNLGTPYMYDFKVELAQGRVLRDVQYKKIGIRDIKVIQKPDSAGSSFYVQVNGVPVFCKGANYIPQDMFIPRVSDGKYKSLIDAAKTANINMLRVWGGGFYEKDLFYDLCDEKGIMVWQDFMFACSMIPGDSAYLDKIQKEASYNINRLRHRPSIVLWCGNNEIDLAWANYQEKAGWGWKQRYTDVQQADLWRNYQKVFTQILPDALKKALPAAFYWSSSPFNTKYAHATDVSAHGDMHYWGVWYAEHDFTAFADHVGRFVSEYGFQSFPEFATVKKFTIAQDWKIDSEVMLSHQRTDIGNQRIKTYMDRYYKTPSDFKNLLYMGQVLQAEGMKVGMETHRRAMPYNMGSLYWQINDCWPVASWSGMDYYQNWKGLHYFVKKAFQNLLVSPYVKNDQLNVQVVSDSLVTVQAKLSLSVTDFTGKVIWNKTQEVSIKPNASALLYTIPVIEVLKGNNKEDVFLAAKLAAKDHTLAENVLYFDRIKNVNLPLVKVKHSLKQLKNGVELSLSANALAKNVYLNFEGTEGHFSDNYFDLLPGETKKVSFITEEKAIGKLSVLTVRDTYKN